MLDVGPGRSYPYLAMAYYRIKRAASHLNDLEQRIITVRRHISEQGVSFNLNAETNDLSINEPLDFHVEVPALLGVLVGETVYNLRCSLDYLVFDLALFRTGMEQNGTQFPIESSEYGWRRHVVDRKCLAGLTPDDIAAIKRCQPCEALNPDWRKFSWLARFRDISNADKHRQWTVIVAMLQGSVSWKAGERGSISDSEGGKRGKIYRTVFSDGREMEVYVHRDFRPEVTLDDGTAIVETLDEFIVKIKEILDALQPEFQGQAAAMERVQEDLPGIDDDAPPPHPERPDSTTPTAR